MTELGKTLRSLKLAANLTFLFNDIPFVERYHAANKAGFKYVESAFPPVEVKLEDVIAAKETTGLEQVLVNMATGKFVI